MFYATYNIDQRGNSFFLLVSIADCRTSEESTAKPLNFAEKFAKIVKYVQYSRDFDEKSALFSQSFVAIPKPRQPASVIISSQFSTVVSRCAIIIIVNLPFRLFNASINAVSVS